MKSAVEQLSGRLIDPDEEVSIATVPPQQVPPAANRALAAQKLDTFLNRRAAKTGDVSDRETDAAVDDAVDHVRHTRG
ncbi:MAG TPA: hypothetical protein VEU96_14185 [Bryobacteraceae bacterium]|nr:hypothetical protein [Bryobacteraceae bacterium]